jgi:hypothetical protein
MSVEDTEHDIKHRIAKWLFEQLDAGEDLGDTPKVLLRFYNQIAVWEAERQSE